MGIESIVNELQLTLDEANRHIKNRDRFLAHNFLGNAQQHLRQYAHVIFATSEDTFRTLIGYYYHTRAKYDRYLGEQEHEMP